MKICGGLRMLVFESFNENIENEGKTKEIENEKKIIDYEVNDEKQEEQKEGTSRKKWYLFGIGGAGCNIVDSILTRKYYLNEVDKDRYLDRVWEMAIKDFRLFDTNTTGIKSSFIATKKGWSAEKILVMCQLGLDEGDTGSGGDRIKGEEAMEYAIESKNMDDFKFTQQDFIKMKESQALMIIHSTTKGTGCGASPVFAGYLKEKMLDADAKNKMIISLTVLPDNTDIDNGIVAGNAFIGLGKIVSSVDAVFLCDNQALFEKIPFGNNEHEYLKKSVPFMWKRNRHIVEFIEALSLQSSWANENPSGVDLMDVIHPAQMSQENKDHAPILVPVLGKIEYSGDITASDVTRLFLYTLEGGKLAQCDYKNAKGASFIIYGSEDAMEQLEELIGNGTNIQEIARSFFNTEKKRKNISIFKTTRKHLTKLYMLGLLWNPPLKAVDMMEERVDECISSTYDLRNDPSIEEAVKSAREVHKDLGYFIE
jgi:cell division GTPase FtsZ